MPMELKPLNHRSTQSAAAGQQLLLLGAVACLLMLGVCAASLPDGNSPKLPFFIGERLTYDVTIAGGNRIGQGTMWVEGPTEIRGTRTYLPRFDSRVRLALFTGVS
ncbi:MAG TPA: hypothetical protein VE110_00445, partial [Gemmatimonadaceae bacterium]|nr:hypothetical protein [Gemmatimonadaceae bacterium]